ncbi:MAG TPA: hypothetical protein VGP46_12380, partial [Acidimicrobiales bacterium]|nr:hypothetical protein [Acidimicrobiales bacterium]
LEGFLGDIEHSVTLIREAYRWAYPNAYERPSRGHSERTSGGGTSDPVAGQAAASEKFRRKLRHALREVNEARNRLLGGQADLNDALNLLDADPLPLDTHERDLVHPANRGDLARAKAAQQRRLARAQSTGDYSEITG